MGSGTRYPRSRIRKKLIPDPDPGVKKHRFRNIDTYLIDSAAFIYQERLFKINTNTYSYPKIIKISDSVCASDGDRSVGGSWG
jgi:hypothetical protein